MRGGLIGILVATSLTLASAAAADEPATGTIELKGGSAGLGIGVSWGKGTLTYEGKQYPISAEGFNVGVIGGASIDASGKVYNLTKLEDFDGSYSGFAAGAALVAGGDAVSMQNQNGVRVEFISKNQGVKLTFASDTVTLKIVK